MAQDDIEDVVENVRGELEKLTEIAVQLRGGQLQPSQAADKITRCVSAVQHEINLLS